MKETNAWHLLWAKTHGGARRESDRYHPLLFHMLDVAAVSALAWSQCLTTSARTRLQRGIGFTDACHLVAFISGAHDIGKASPSFQACVERLGQATGLPFSRNDQSRPHGFVSAHTIREFLGGSCLAGLLGQIIGGHHGVFPRAYDLRFGKDVLGKKEWEEARVALLDKLWRCTGASQGEPQNLSHKATDPFVVPVLAGFVSVVDWVASNQEFFPCVAVCGETPAISPEDYWKSAQQQAQKALAALGWLPSVEFQKESEFGKVFKGFTPNGLQEKVIKIAKAQYSPYLMIVEAPMGHGKTEAALYAADLAMCRGFARGMYVAMPTQATGNAMFARVLDDYLKGRGHSGKLNVQLVHGNALLADLGKDAKEGEIEGFDPNSVQDDTSAEGAKTADVEAQSWFTARKRPLLAPFGVGTIDQILLSVLQTKHWFVRMFGLAGKVVIFDEVHAYDAYMSTILERLLQWLAELDCTVILLSATLPDARRCALARAYSGTDGAECQRYPRITLANPSRFDQETAPCAPKCREVPMGESKTVKLGIEGTDVEELSKMLSCKLKDGGCAAVICNTVNRSIEVFQHLRDNLADTECLLFHARTLQMWRRRREDEVLGKFGKKGQRPHRAVLVATQVVEQSLDLDFDLMVSEIAPIDLLLQRSGRLHRHLRQRPRRLKGPELIVLCHGDTNGPPPETFGKNIEYVYERYILLRTWLALRERKVIEVPTQIEKLIEFVYGTNDAPKADGWPEALNNAKEKMNSERRESEKRASRLLVSKPKAPADLIEDFNNQLADDEDPVVHKGVRADTREGDPSITVVMQPEGETLAAEPNISEVKRLLECSVKISHPGLFQAFLENGEQPKEWKENAHLRHARLLRLDEANRGKIPHYCLQVDEKLGVVITVGGEE